MAKPTYHIQLKGYVGREDFNLKEVDKVLDKNGNSHVDVLINSTGGSLVTGMSISASFQNHGDVAVHFVGLNASAATIASLGAKHISMDAGAMYLVHKCSVDFFKWASMNADNFAALIADATRQMEDLDKLDQNIARLYAARCKRDPKDILTLMERGGWMSADEALSWGFIDEITNFADDPKAMLTDTMASVMLSAGMPVPSIPFQQDYNSGFIEKIFNAISSIFKSQTSNSMSTTTKTYSAEEYDSLSAQLDEQTASAASAQAKVTELEAKITELEAKLAKTPGGSSTQVLENNKDKSNNEPTVFDTFCEKVNNAAALFNEV